MAEILRCKVTSVALSQLEVKLGPNGLTLTVDALLLDNAGLSHGRNKCVGPWNGDTLEKLNELVASIENELINLHFEVDNGDDTRTDEFFEKPKGLLGSRLGGTEDPTPQL